MYSLQNNVYNDTTNTSISSRVYLCMVRKNKIYIANQKYNV